jgi:hypothetical protein
MKRRFACGILGTLLGCSAALTGDQTSAAQGGSDGVSANSAAMSAADALFDFDPTIDPTHDAPTNAMAIQNHVQSELGSCGTVMLSGASVTVSFGSGCTLTNGDVISGSETVAVSASNGTITLALTFTNLVVNGKSISGTASFSTSDGTTFDVTTSLDENGNTHTGMFTVTGSDGTFTISGTANIAGSSTLALTFTNVVHTRGECWATSGSVDITEGVIQETMTFDANTPTTGDVTVTVGKHSSTTELPAYGSCP